MISGECVFGGSMGMPGTSRLSTTTEGEEHGTQEAGPDSSG
jgi:hypothetical protein